MKASKLNIFVCLTCGIVILGVVFFPIGADNFWKNVSQFHIKWIIAAFLCMLLFWLFESWALHIVVRSACKEYTFRQSVRVNMGGQYFHCVTPFATGGQPFQAYYLRKQGVDLGVAANCLVIKFIIYKFAMVIISALLLIARLSYFRTSVENFTVLVIFGFIINLAVMLWALSLIFFKNTTRKFAIFIIRLFTKIKIIKDPAKKQLQLDSMLETFNCCFREMMRDIPMVVRAFFLSILHILSYMLVPYMIYRAFGLRQIDPVTIISAQAFVMLVSSFVPIPGAGGGAEGAFYVFFRSFFPKAEQLGIALLLWRFITFYFTVIVSVFFAIRANKTPVS